MIGKDEVLRHAEALGLSTTTVEKDYVLGWTLMAIAQDPLLSSGWMFKGGTSLKKAYFPDYRFSEDLDFTVLNRSLFAEDLLQSKFKQLTDWICQKAGIEFPSIRFDTYKNRVGGTSVQGRLYYRGPLRRKSGLPKIKIDLIFDELVVFPAETRPILHGYSDAKQIDATLSCYALDEVFAEKVRALMERIRARDLYDVIGLFHQTIYPLDRVRVEEAIQQKCRYRELPFPTAKAIRTDERRGLLADDWERALRHQLPKLEPLDTYWNSISDMMDWIAHKS